VRAALDAYFTTERTLGKQAMSALTLVEVAFVAAAHDRHAEVAAAAGRLVDSPWRDAAIAISGRRYAAAAEILAALPCLPLRDAVAGLVLA
jgi:hypothetical protein